MSNGSTQTTGSTQATTESLELESTISNLKTLNLKVSEHDVLIKAVLVIGITSLAFIAMDIYQDRSAHERISNLEQEVYQYRKDSFDDELIFACLKRVHSLGQMQICLQTLQ